EELQQIVPKYRIDFPIFAAKDIPQGTDTFDKSASLTDSSKWILIKYQDINADGRAFAKVKSPTLLIADTTTSDSLTVSENISSADSKAVSAGDAGSSDSLNESINLSALIGNDAALSGLVSTADSKAMS